MLKLNNCIRIQSAKTYHMAWVNIFIVLALPLVFPIEIYCMTSSTFRVPSLIVRRFLQVGRGWMLKILEDEPRITVRIA